MARSTVHYADNKTNNALKKLHNKLRPAGTPVQRVEYIIELLLLRIFETKIKQDDEFKPLRKLFTADYRWKNPKTGKEESNENRLFSYLPTVSNDQILAELNDNFFPFYSTILQSARQVFAGNLPQKVQDQLVLIEEVFSNSNFTNNVNSGNLGEVISVVAHDIEEARLLKTDLLGDAIESALSETGGTKDIGLFRTPDHIRQFMTALVEPNFDDIVFDSACGTGGFLFDAFEFVMRRVDSTRDWPGEKSHSELRSWFNEYFENHPLDFPSIEQTTQFYRSGVAGIEYLGMIRKMAAINFYIRGLNPANIQQGDSLAKYNPVTDAGSKTVVIANPPFGAERDQEAYPEVWGEYPKESETTILFVKLMFDLLHDGGRCAVIVSEGFHTWDQNSAKALRKMLLDEAQLKAVISLPQGLFVSKGGQGPKTSILLYEKGGKTDWVWFYKVTNDGYTMGTNRKEQKGNQLVECLDLFYKYVKNGNRPPESKNQFCIPSDWIKTLDPRIKERIRTETRLDIEAKGKIDRIKKAEDINKKIASKKITEAEKKMELEIFDQMLENRVQNEIAKRIDKAFNYSFNLSNYRSNLSASQLIELKEVIPNIAYNGSKALDEIYKNLSLANPEASLPYLAKLNHVSALEADIAREYIGNLDERIILKHNELKIIKQILNSGAKYFKVSIKESCSYEKGTLATQATPPGVFPFVVTAKERKTAPEYQFDTKAVCIPLISSTGHGSATLNRIHYQEGKFALANLLFAAIPNDPETELFPKFLYYILDARREELFCPLMKGTANVAMRMEDAVNVRFPIPPIEIQKEVVSQIEKQKEIIEGVEKIERNWDSHLEIDKALIQDSKYISVGDICTFEYGEPLKESDRIDGKYPVVGAGNIIGYNNKYYLKGPVIVTGRRGATSGSIQWIDNDCFVIDTAFYVKIISEEEVDKRYLFYALKNLNLQKLQSGGAMPGINRNDVYKEKFYLPDIETQRKIVSNLDEKIQVLRNLQILKIEAEGKIKIIIAELWG